MKFNFLTHISMTSNLLKSVVTTAVIATSSVSADTPNVHSATNVAVSGESINFKSKIAKIDAKIIQIQTKISIIEQKPELSDQDYDSIDTLDKEFKALTAEKLVIVDNQNNQRKEKVAIIDDRIEKKEDQLSIAEQKLAALDRVSRILRK